MATVFERVRDIAADKLGQVSLIATDIIDSLPKAFKVLAMASMSCMPTKAARWFRHWKL